MWTQICIHPGEIDPKRKLCWWWRLESGDVSFSILLAKDPSKDVAEDPEDTVIRPKFKLQTEYVPEEGQVCGVPIFINIYQFSTLFCLIVSYFYAFLKYYCRYLVNYPVLTSLYLIILTAHFDQKHFIILLKQRCRSSDSSETLCSPSEIQANFFVYMCVIFMFHPIICCMFSCGTFINGYKIT